MGQKINQSSVVEIKQRSPWHDHPTVDFWGDSMGEHRYNVCVSCVQCNTELSSTIHVFILLDSLSGYTANKSLVLPAPLLAGVM